MTDRLARLRKTLARKNLDGIVVTQPQNIRYLSGFTSPDALLIITQSGRGLAADKALLATDFRYFEQVADQSPHFELLALKDKPHETLGACWAELHEQGLYRLAYEKTHLTVDRHKRFRQVLPRRVRFRGTEGLVEDLRMVKDDAEIDAIRRAVLLGDAAFMAVAPRLNPGMTEKAVAWQLEAWAREHGAERASFEFIVAGGPNAAKPHAVQTDRPIQEGEPVTVDMGVVVDGYCSDMTRTFCLGEPDSKFREIWHIVLEAQEKATAGIRAGVTGQAIDTLARDVIAQAGYGENFGHGLGHGVGLAVHEAPGLSQRYPKPLPAGSVVTVEPGIYLTGWGGVRIEDMVVVRANGAEVLTTTPKTLTNQLTK
ncbi:MAG: Xaa-Pro peptidase family protein [Chloroflexi bacterium]|nr:Xaa-Pro peptidase family protein [Chloroflexota bacterium]MBU1746064.1 Xaa-Pro peptidase family protein [Chloroflexota bacterium]MBU1879125.1 Xaa-Pro peptidase family protein [Chloroflexota bacterium]